MTSPLPLALTDFGGSGPLLVLGPSLGTSVGVVWGAVAEQLTDRFSVKVLAEPEEHEA